jgi:penicillin-binding protein 1B
VLVRVDPATGALATTGCPGALVEAFISGTQPVDVCRLHGGLLASSTQVNGWDTPGDAATVASSEQETAAGGAGHQPARRRTVQAAAKKQEPASQPAPPKKGFFRRILDMFK